MFTKILSQININKNNITSNTTSINNIKVKRHVGSGSGYPRAAGTYFNDTSKYNSWNYVYQQDKMVTFQGIITGRTGSDYLTQDNFFVISSSLAPSGDTFIPAIYQKPDGSVSAWRAEVTGYDSTHGYIYIKAPTGYISRDTTSQSTWLRVNIHGSWMIR